MFYSQLQSTNKFEVKCIAIKRGLGLKRIAIKSGLGLKTKNNLNKKLIRQQVNIFFFLKPVHILFQKKPFQLSDCSLEENRMVSRSDTTFILDFPPLHYPQLVVTNERIGSNMSQLKMGKIPDSTYICNG